MFCRIYVSGLNASSEFLMEQLQVIDSALIRNGSYLEKNECMVTVRENREYNITLEKEFPDGFLHFRYLIEIEYNDDEKFKAATNFVTQILKTLWLSVPAVASCDFEHLLPESGGYNSKNIPWPS